MSFGLNRVELIGRLGADVMVNHLSNGGRVANLSIATDESYINKQTGEKVDKTEWHRVVTFQDGLVDMFEKHARKGRLVYVDGKLQTRRWSKPGEEGDRYSTEILLVPGGRIQFLDQAERQRRTRRGRPVDGGGPHRYAGHRNRAAARGLRRRHTVLNSSTSFPLTQGRRFARRPFSYGAGPELASSRPRALASLGPLALRRQPAGIKCPVP